MYTENFQQFHDRIEEEDDRSTTIDRSSVILYKSKGMAASWLQGVKICRRYKCLCKDCLEVKLTFIVIICITLPTTSYAQPADSTGFLSIDCGYTGPNYTDSTLGLEWVGDYGTYIKTGTPFQMPSYDWNNSLYLYAPNIGNIEAFKTFRYFPEGRNKYCYELPTASDSSYLIRATFFMNQTVLSQRQPFYFTVSINATDWFTIASGEELSMDYRSVQEGIFYPTNDVTNFCLQPLVGMPFISALELRPLEDLVYTYPDCNLQYLNLLFRYNMGSPWNASAVRWPDDKFDRIWSSILGGNDYLPVVSSPTAPDNTSGTNAAVYYVPPEVMKDAWAFFYPNDTVQASLFQDQSTLTLTPGQYAFAILYSEHLNISDPNVYVVNVTLDMHTNLAFNYSHQASILMDYNFVLSSNYITTKLDLESGEHLTDGPTMNAGEVYAQYNFNFSTTNGPDDTAIEVLKASFSLDDWQGDPCTPVPHDWLECSLNSPLYQPIRQPCNSNQTLVTECVVQEGFLRSTYYVNAINFSNLPTIGFSLLQATPNVSLGSLTNISIRDSGVDSQTFQYFLSNFSQADMLILLDFSNNTIDSVPSWENLGNLTILNLAHNNITTSDNPNVLPLSNSLQELNLSFNSMTSIPQSWQNTSNGLVILDLSYNLLRGDISSLDHLVQMNTNGTLQELYVSNNKLNGTFSSSIYFSGPYNLTIADFSDNFIEGTLDLSIWYNILKSSTSGSLATSGSENATASTILFSFLNNNITNIVPDAGTFESIKSIQDGTLQGGILLGGNPYCNGASSYTQRYLCRNNVGEPVPKDHKSNKTAIILGICGGIGALLLCFVVLASSWKMWQQIYELRKIQQALAERKVQPPFFQYSDLKLASGDFKKDNKLGHGSFGTVYKAILADGTMLAVKKLFDGGKVIVLDEFLNEVVLITGIKHRNLVQLKGCCIKDKQRLLVYEYVEKGNLAEALWGSKAHGGLNWVQRFNICVGVARGLAYLHEELQPSIIHRDIKPANILLDKNYNPKIADFGLALYLSEASPTSDSLDVAGTLGYLAPEYAMHGYLSEKADVYSFGIVVLELVSGRKCIDKSLPAEEILLRNWIRSNSLLLKRKSCQRHFQELAQYYELPQACNLIRNGNLLDVLQPELRDSCVFGEVVRAINIALLCVQHHQERRPSMSHVVTMLLGNMNVEGFLGESANLQCSFNDLMTSITQDIDYPVLQRLAEDSTLYKPLSLDDESSISTVGGRPSARRLIDLSSTVHAR